MKNWLKICLVLALLVFSILISTGAKGCLWWYESEHGHTTTGSSADTWTWSPTSIDPPPPSERYGHTAIWTGQEMIIWGGGLGPMDDGALYYPITDTWDTGVTMVDAPEAREAHTAVWTGSEMIIWGGEGLSNQLDTGGRYKPPTVNTWTPTTTTDAPLAREGHTAVWTGSEMIIWGGRNDAWGIQNTGAKYYPITNTWVSVTITGTPSARFNHTAVWTGTEMLVWGGWQLGNVTNTGAKYNPSTDTWEPITTDGAPAARQVHNAVWTGTEMIVWGGMSSMSADDVLNTGARYNPSTDTWTPITTDGTPAARYSHTVVWTGTEMIIWGGTWGAVPNDTKTNTGARYNPSTDTWITCTLTGAPCARVGHSAVWTGTEMIIWAGWEESPSNSLNTGARYKP